MDLRNLRHLVALARRLSFSRAAQDLGLSQPALTRSIQSLERQAGMRLFDRDRAGVTLTPQGRIVVERAAALLAEADEFERSLHRTASGEAGRIRFGMAPLPAWTLLPTALAGRINAAPGLGNEVLVRNVDALWPLLIGGDIEFFVSAEGQIPDAPLVRAETLGVWPVSLIVRAGHPLLESDCPDRAFPVMISGQVGFSNAVLDHPPSNTAGQPHVIEDYATLASLTRTTDAVWISSAYSVADDLAAQTLCTLDRLDPNAPASFRMMLYSLERRSQSPGMQKLKQAFRARTQELATLLRGTAE